MPYQSFTTDSGRTGYVVQIRIRDSAYGFLAGTIQAMRLIIVRRLPEEVAREFGTNALLVREPPVANLPAYTFFLHLQSDPISPDFDYSELVLVWFADQLPTDFRAEMTKQLKGVKWEKLAKDGEY